MKMPQNFTLKVSGGPSEGGGHDVAAGRSGRICQVGDDCLYIILCCCCYPIESRMGYKRVL